MKHTTGAALILAAACSTSSAFTPTPITNTRTSTRLFAGDDKDDLWGKPPSKDGEEMSKALPFAPRPKLLDGSLPGDVGFDPFGFAGNDKESLLNQREAEIKHCRLAMLAAAGWPLAELFDKKIAALFDLPVALTKSGASPSLLNGGLEKIDPEYWVLVASIAALAELANSGTKEEKGKNYIPGDCGFDPLGLFPEDKKEQIVMQTKEIKHGRIAMMAILGFVVQEALYGTPVTSETPFFFSPIWS